MTKTRYIADMLEMKGTILQSIESVADALLPFENNHPKRRAVFCRKFEEFSTDIGIRFFQTIGIHKSIVAVADSLPQSEHPLVASIKTEARNMLRVCIENSMAMEKTFADYADDDIEYSFAVEQIVGNASSSCAALHALARSLSRLEPSNDPALITLKAGLLPLVLLAAKDYELLVELFEEYGPASTSGVLDSCRLVA